MGKLIMLVVLLSTIYYIGTNYKSIDIVETRENIKNKIENTGAIGIVRNTRGRDNQYIKELIEKN